MSEDLQTPRRRRNLTDEDIAAIGDALAASIKVHTACNMGLTNDEVSTLKRFLAAIDNAAGIIGKTILTALVGAFIAVVTKGFWITLISGIKQGTPK